MEPSTTGAAIWVGGAEDDDFNDGADLQSEAVHGRAPMAQLETHRKDPQEGST